MKILVGLVLFAISFAISAVAVAEQPHTLDGLWIKKSIDSYERVTKNRVGTEEDLQNSLSFMAYLDGFSAVHRQNNLMASLLVYSLTEEKKKTKNPAALAAIDKQMRVAFAFTPLLRLPDNLSMEQSIVIIRKYLEDNPQKWNSEASLIITTALSEAFEKK